MIPFLDLSRRYESISHEVDAAVNGVLHRGHYILGENVQAFEEEFAHFCGGRYGIGVGSGTEAIHLTLRGLGIGPGDEVITAAHTAVATVAAIELAGARPVLVDIDPTTMTIDPSAVAAAITPRTAAVIPVHLYGHPADMDPLLQLCARHHLALVEDCAQAHGALYKGRPVGGLGQAGCFSFYPTKNMGAYGDGGIIVTNDPILADRLHSLREYGWQERYISLRRGGMNTRLDEIQAAILRVHLRHLEEWNARRRHHAAFYDKELAGLKDVTLPIAMAWALPVYHVYVIRSPRRADLAAFLHAQGIGTAIHYPLAIHQQPAYADLAPAGSLPHSEEACARVLSLPVSPEMTVAEAQAVAQAVRSWAIQADVHHEGDDPAMGREVET